MKTALRKCTICVIYTLKDICPRCGTGTIMPIPPRYSPQDAYGEYRRRLKKLASGSPAGELKQEVKQ